eukprot:6163690-Pleurochrysis_carterae.AAC.5
MCRPRSGTSAPTPRTDPGGSTGPPTDTRCLQPQQAHRTARCDSDAALGATLPARAARRGAASACRATR